MQRLIKTTQVREETLRLFFFKIIVQLKLAMSGASLKMICMEGYIVV